MRDVPFDAAPVDVCLVVEGCYPFITGGVSTWLDWLMRNQPDLRFGVVALAADDTPREARMPLPDNLAFLQILPLAPSLREPSRPEPRIDERPMVDALCGVMGRSDVDAFADLIALLRAPAPRRQAWPWRAPDRSPLSRGELMDSLPMWRVMLACLERLAPSASFVDLFWAWRSLLGGCFSVLTAPIPAARSYHAISTGYAGLYAARASIETGAPLLITEHGIYTNERRIDLIAAEWIVDMIDRGRSIADPRHDVRDFWIASFDAFARVAYAAAARVTTLYGANQSFQTELGARRESLRVIPNGIALEKFDALDRTPRPRRPTVALIGRVVPIKDVETMIVAAAVMRDQVADVQVLIMGPTDEDPAYFDACTQKMRDLDLAETVVFTGKVNIFDYMADVDIVVLTSISEAQPLVLLEAGAACIPCVSTDVGSCREIIEGAPDEMPNLGPGGRVCPPMDAAGIGGAVAELLRDPDLRARCGRSLRMRVERHFTSAASAGQYRELYDEAFAS